MKKKILAIFLVLVIGYSIYPVFHMSVSSSKKVYRQGEVAVFTISNDSLFDGMTANTWIIEQKSGGKWITVLEPSPYLGGFLLGFPSGYNQTQRINLGELKSGSYRYCRDAYLIDNKFRVYTHFFIE